MANAIANEKSICNVVYVCLTVCYDCILQMANKMLKLCVQDNRIPCTPYRIILYTLLDGSVHPNNKESLLFN